MVLMASVRRFLLLALLLLVLVFGASQAAAAGDGGVKKVRVELYYESLCPYSASFVVNDLAKVFEDGLIEAADVALFPYGNAEVGENGDISCQHGPDECLLNTVEACAIDVWPDSNVHFSFVNCVEGLVMKGTHQEWKSCFVKLGLDTKPFAKCFESERGHELSLKLGKVTEALVPPHEFVPWVVVDGKPLLEDFKNFEVYVCKAYKGTPPKVCQGLVDRRPEVDGGVSYKSGNVIDDLGSGIVDGGSVAGTVKKALPEDYN